VPFELREVRDGDDFAVRCDGSGKGEHRAGVDPAAEQRDIVVRMPRGIGVISRRRLIRASATSWAARCDGTSA
jgi:hypothetical protein